MSKKELIDRTIEKLKSLPEDKIIEVEDFTDFLMNQLSRKSDLSATELMQLPIIERQKILENKAKIAEDIYKDTELVMDIVDEPIEY